MHVLLTNDDGIDSPGLAALHDRLRAAAEVTVVAPAGDRSGVGRSRSDTVDVREHERGYAVEGTPADCVAFGLRGLEDPPGVVVSGCNHGPNVGAYIIGHSGTVGAAVEAAFLGAPALAVSAYHPDEFMPRDDTDEFALAARVTEFLLDRTLGSGVFDAADLLNVNVPAVAPGTDVPMRVTKPLADYDAAVERDAEGIHLRNLFWAETGTGPGVFPDDPAPARDSYPEGTDRRAILEGRISVSPLVGPHGTEHHAALDEVAAAFEDRPG